MSRLKKKLSNLWGKFRQGLLQMFSASILNSMIGMLSNMIITRVLSKSEFGIWSYIMNFYSYLVIFTGFGLLSGVFQFGAENKGKKEEYSYYKYCLFWGMIIDTVLVIIVIIGSCILDFSLEGVRKYLIMAIPLLLIEYILNLCLTVLRCQNRIREYAKILNINTVLLALGICVGAVFGVKGVIIGKYTAYSFSLIHIIKKLKQELGLIYNAPKIHLEKIKSLWHYSVFTGTSSGLNMMMYLLDVSIVAFICKSPEKVAIYKVATLIPNALTFIPTSINVCILPTIVSNKENMGWIKKYISKVFFFTGLFNLFVCMFCIIFSSFIIKVLSGEEYLPAVPIFNVLIISYFITGTFRSLSANILAALRQVYFNLFVSIVSILCNILFNVILINKFGIIGAAYATLGVVLVASLLAFFCLMIKLWDNKNDCF